MTHTALFQNLLSIFPQPMLVYYSVALLHVFSALYFAVVRWFHVCAPYKHNPDYYFPARKWISIMCLFVLLETPYIINPASDVCFLTACAVLAVNYPLSAIMVSFAYFKARHSEKDTLPLIWMSLPVLVLEILFVALTLVEPQWCEEHLVSLIVALSTVSLLTYLLLALFCWELYRKLKAQTLDNYSDDSSVPTRMGYSALVSMLVIFVLTSLPLVTQSRMAMAFVQMVLIVWHLVFLVFVLDSQVSPEQDDLLLVAQLQRMGGNNALPEKEKPADDVGGQLGAETHLELEANLELEDENVRLFKRIENLMQTARPYLRPGYTAVELAAELGTNRTYLTQAIKTNYESFYHLINSYRLKYAQDYLNSHPEMKKEQLAIAAGFGSYRSYLRALKSISC